MRHNGMAASQMLVTPAPFSTVLWRAVAMGPEHYHEAYFSLLDGGAAKDAAAVCRPCIWGQPLPGQTCSETQCGCVGIPDGGMHCCCKEAK